jgi:hypothetical protein
VAAAEVLDEVARLPVADVRRDGLDRQIGLA